MLTLETSTLGNNTASVCFSFVLVGNGYCMALPLSYRDSGGDLTIVHYSILLTLEAQH